MTPSEDPGAPEAKTTRAIVFADVCKSTQLFERYGNAQALQIVGRAISVLSTVTVEHGGAVVKTIGDEVMATFPDASAATEAASAMQKAVQADASLAQFGVSIKVGLHVGPVILEDGDVFGDAVNVAARMVGLTKADQILTTRATVDRLPPGLQSTTRSLGQTEVRGKEQPIEICEVVWHQDHAVLTMVAAPAWGSVQQEKKSRLVLAYASREFVIEAGGRPFQMGRGEGNDLVIQDKGVSRTHATIEFSKGYFVLTDRSTNGTYLRVGDEEIFLRRDQTHLLREGVISLGQVPSGEASKLVQYRCEY